MTTFTRRAVLGHGSRNQPATANTIAYLRTVTGASDLDSADGIRIIGNTMTGRGIYGALASNGVIADNTISQIPCGIGPGIWLMTFSNNWTIAGNDISDIAISTAAHYMQGASRLGSAADYNRSPAISCTTCPATAAASIPMWMPAGTTYTATRSAMWRSAATTRCPAGATAGSTTRSPATAPMASASA